MAVTHSDALAALRFDNTFVRDLPADPEPKTYVRAVNEAAYSRVQPTPVSAPELLAWSAEVAELLDLPRDGYGGDRERLARVFSGNELLPGMEPYAACYGGHQFGHWAGQLGDGRAMSLGEVVNRAGERWELQLKGAGPTPYSRRADGRAVLRSSIREFLCSEAMHHLGVPTTRALSLVGTGDRVVRDMFYDGNARPEPGAIVCRVAPSFIRFGNFEIFASRDDRDNLRRLADYTLRRHFDDLLAIDDERHRIVAMFERVCATTAEMIAGWMRVGFVHGVMNTDNMSILGQTIDYGPYGWLDDFDPTWTPNTTDAQGRRYAYGNQPRIALWNLSRLGSALHPLVGAAEPLEAALREYGAAFERAQRGAMQQKLGLEHFEAANDDSLVDDLFELLASVETDMTLFFRALAEVPESDDPLAVVEHAYYEPGELSLDQRQRALEWLRRYGKRVAAEGRPVAERRAAMNRVNPKYVLRNYLAQLAIDEAEQGDPFKVRELLDVMRRPYDDQPGREEYAAKRPDWARQRAGCSMLSCSS